MVNNEDRSIWVSSLPTSRNMRALQGGRELGMEKGKDVTH